MIESSMGNMEGTLKPVSVLTKQRRIAELAMRHKGKAINSLNHYLDEEWLKYAYDLTRKDGAIGVDGQTAADYEKNLQTNLRDLLERIKSGRYKALPVRRVYIPKADRSLRPLGIPAFEEKVAQRAIVLLLEPIYEQDFKDFSYGFRPNKSAHQALERLRTDIMERGGRWTLDVDLRRFFDTIDHGKLRELMAKRIVDGVIIRLINKWLKAGVLEKDQLIKSTLGTIQGGVISPLLANVYLHYALDEWFENDVVPRMKKRASLVRFCDDFVMVFEDYTDCIRVHRVLAARMGRFALTVHEEKTRIVDFRFKRTQSPANIQATTFNFLGFTHVWGKSRKGKNIVCQNTAKDRYAKALKSLHDWCKRNRHQPIEEQHKRLSRMMHGHYAYYGITNNGKRLRWYAKQGEKIWHKWLSRRTRQGNIRWDRFEQTLQRYPLPKPKIIHQYTRASKPTL